jgi:hypothetical protein
VAADPPVFDANDQYIGQATPDHLTYLTWLACRNHDARSRDLMLSTCGRLAVAVGMGPLKGMSREMVFVRSGLRLGLISPTNDPIRQVAEAFDAKLYEDGNGVVIERTA